ncbi:Peptidase C19 ubiquitin carboxyl-terminal hydrolase 2 [Penicillium samsonianum]|uniref:Peptidase C19 ubiquitin carboxyl-terminal hydrolase 2 n=1 Tax=Penicillium samsonianum TaxID=1882272 RepID=UPI002547C903|nr:Peptidase C19 ubiquitin carboxyl-terminal hydrolase 2 [Penicillium samsonianum]KAJ6149237.1 Peptidase C19 ubiquitin carboxyl-terminal hydrolase 2 [Penicillium samsonianum]
MASVQKAGKTVPRLIHDVQLYDPAHDPDTGRNLLSETPPVYPEGYNGPPGFISPEACRHEYVLKEDQTFMSEPEHRRRPGTSSKVSAICTKCRYHLQVVVNYTNFVSTFGQNQGKHLHHLVYKSGRQKNGLTLPEETLKGQVAETYHYQCSYPSCSAMVSLRILSPILSPEFIHLMTDKELLRKRAEEATAAYAESMEGMGDPQPINVLDNLRLYITNALRNPQRSKPISSVNKRFMHSFGVEGAACKELLEFLEFMYNTDTGAWHPPKPTSDAEKPYQDTMRLFLDDLLHELLVLIHLRSASERRGSQIPDLPSSAIPVISCALEAQDYPTAMRYKEFEMAYAPFYEDLGVMEDMSSSAVVEAYNRQVSVDPGRTSMYLSALKAIGFLRGGQDKEVIDIAVQAAYDQGKYDVEDVVSAYQYFNLHFDDPNLTEDSIIGKFYAFLSSTTQDTEARLQLWRIGDSRGSARIKAASEDRVSTVEQANVFLGVEDQTPDDFVMTMYTAKVNDSPLTKELAKRAVALIAESRKSVALKHFINTGEMIAGEMDIGDAYRLLQIPDRTADDGAIIAAYTICIDENPGDAERYNQALTIIAKQLDSSTLRNMAGISNEPDRSMQDWPVGLQNIGNTCYLNSLLQFYFSVRPFRELILDFERFQMDLNDEETLAKKQVGSRKVTKKEVERSQRFLTELRTLFRSMITSSQISVTPGQELARLTLISPSNEAAIRRRSTITATRSEMLGDINGAPILGPLGPPQTLLGGRMEPVSSSGQADAVPIRNSAASDNSSDTTLVSDNSMNDAPGLFIEDKENNPPDLDQLSDQAEPGSPQDMSIDPDDSVPSNLPPPVPPRNVPQVDREKQLKEEVEIGAQQDVTEVINNVLFQSQCAIKPRGIGSDGEQLDQIKDLFYGQTRSYISTEKGTRSKDERWCDIKVDVAHGSRNIYDAIDGAFDIQKISVENSVAEQFASISQLPPVLQIQVQRVQFDPVKKCSFKSTNHLGLLETIYMDRYMDTKNPDVVDRRNQCWEWKASLKRLEARREELLRTKEGSGVDMATLFRKVKTALQDVDSIENDTETGAGAEVESDSMNAVAGTEFLDELESLAHKAETDLQAVDQEIKDTQTMISSQFADFHNLPYRLYAVFVHHGSVSFGHYYIYIFDFDKKIWRKYNDEYVTEVQNVDEIFKNDSTSNPPTPYFLVYVNDSMKDRLANPVCREVSDNISDLPDLELATTMEGVEPTSPAPDVNMEPPSYEEASAINGTPVLVDSNVTPVDAEAVNPLKRKSADEMKPTRPT